MKYLTIILILYGCKTTQFPEATDPMVYTRLDSLTARLGRAEAQLKEASKPDTLMPKKGRLIFTKVSDHKWTWDLDSAFLKRNKLDIIPATNQ